MKINTDIGNDWLKVFKSIEELNKNLDKLPDNGTVVYTYGAWDLFHPGHVHFLTRARDLGNYPGNVATPSKLVQVAEKILSLMVLSKRLKDFIPKLDSA